MISEVPFISDLVLDGVSLVLRLQVIQRALDHETRLGCALLRHIGHGSWVGRSQHRSLIVVDVSGSVQETALLRGQYIALTIADLAGACNHILSRLLVAELEPARYLQG